VQCVIVHLYTIGSNIYKKVTIPFLNIKNNIILFKNTFHTEKSFYSILEYNAMAAVEAAIVVVAGAVAAVAGRQRQQRWGRWQQR
jgi:hypothetical protein